MFTANRILVVIAAATALVTNACSVTTSRPASAAQNTVVCAGGTIRSAQDAVLFAGCDSISGDLRVSAADLEDLSALAGLKRVSGTLEISQNPELDDLHGLERLEQVGGITIRNNPELSDLSGLSGLVRAAHVTIDHNGIYRATGISSLAEVGDLTITNNAKLNSLEGFSSLQHARSLHVEGNPRLCARHMLPALERVDGELNVSKNRGVSMPDLRGLLGRVERGLAQPTEASREASL
jgi:hypothetical protein